MAFDNHDYPNRKDWRKAYRGSKAFDRSCRNHGSCGYCECNRMFRTTQRLDAANDQLREFNHTETEPDMTQEELIAAVKAHALKNYEKGGWDVIIECWSDEDIAKVLTEDKATTLKAALKAFAPLIDVWSDRQADAENSKF